MADNSTESKEPVEAEGASTVLTVQERITAMTAHFLALATFFLGPLVVYLMRKNRSEFIAFHALQVVYYQVAYVVLVMLCTAIFGRYGISLLALLQVGNVVYLVAMGLLALDGDSHEYLLFGDLARKTLR